MNAKEKVFESFIWMVEILSKTIYNYEKLNFTIEDLEQELKIVLWKSINSYVDLLKKNKEISVPIKKYCFICLKNAKLDFIRKIKTKKRNIDFEPLGEIVQKERNDFLSVSIPEEGMDIFIDGVNILDFEDLEDIYKIIFKDFLIGYSIKELSEIYNFSQREIKRKIIEIRTKIRKKYFSYFLQSNSLESTFLNIRNEDEKSISFLDQSFEDNKSKIKIDLKMKNKYNKFFKS